MRWFIRKICPRKGLALKGLGTCGREGLSQQVHMLGHLEAGVVGTRFVSNGCHSFHGFMARLLTFQHQNRATAEGLLMHPWLQTHG